MDGGAPDEVGPVVTGVTVSGTGQGVNGVFRAGDVLQVTVEFNEAATVTGTPQVELTIGSTPKQADYASGSGTTSLVFRYTVAAGDADANGISVEADALALNGGTIVDGAATPNAAALGLGSHAITDGDAVVDGAAAAAGPTVTGVTVEPGLPQGAGGKYIAGDALEVTVEFSRPATVTGTPQLALTIGSVTRQAGYVSGSGTASLVFRYTVVRADDDPNGISIGASALTLNGGTIADTANNNATLDLGSHAITDGDAVVDGDLEDTVAPTVTRRTLSGRPQGRKDNGDGLFREGDVIEARFEFNEPVTVTGRAWVLLYMAPYQSHQYHRDAAYVSGSGTKELLFAYTVAANDADADEVWMFTGPSVASGGNLADAANNWFSGRALYDTTENDIEIDADAADGVGPVVTGVSLRGTPTGASSVYRVGDAIEVTVEFDEAVTVGETGGPPQLALTLTSGTSRAEYSSGSGTTSLVFTYTVVNGDTDTDGVSVGAAALTLNGGTIRDAASNDATLDLGSHAITDGDIVVNAAAADVVAPTVTGVTVSGTARGAGGVFRAGDEIEVTVEFDEEVTVTGTPRVTLAVGVNTRRAAYASGSGTAELVFRYTVVSIDRDLDGISVAATALALNGGTIADAAGNAATLGLGDSAITDGDAEVDGRASDAIAPTVAGVTLSAVAPAPQGANGVFRAGDALEATVEFSEPVTVTGTPQVELTIGSTPKPAAYVSGSGTASLVFRYAVAAGDADANGISVAAAALTLNGGTIFDGAATPNAAALDLGSHAIADDADFPVNGGADDRVGPAVTGLTLDGNAQGANGVFIAGDRIAVTVEFDDAATVTGTPQVELTIGSTPKPARYVSGSGTTSLVFRYTVAAADADADGISVAAAALTLNGGTIRDGAATPNAAALGLGSHAIANDGGFPVNGAAADAVAPTVTGVTLSGHPNGANGVYIAGDAIEVAVEFSETVAVTGTPQVALTVGEAARQAAYDSGSGETSLVFRYTVVSGDADADGISVEADALALNGGTIFDGAATPNAAALGLGSHAIANDADFAVDGGAADVVGPAVTGVTPAGTATGANGVFRAGDAIEVTVEFNETVTVTGTPQLALTIGSAPRQAEYDRLRSAATPATDDLVFRYTVVSGDADADGISVEADALALNGGTIFDGAATPNAAALDLGRHAIANDPRFKVRGAAADAAPPVVAGVSLDGTATGANGVFRAGDAIEVTVEFSETVAVTGTPQVALTVGEAARQAAYDSGSGETSLVFRYTVALGDRDANGVSVEASALTLNGGTIADAAGNSAADDNGEVPLGSHAITDGDAVVDGDAPDATGPTVEEVSLSGHPNGANGVFIAGDAIAVTVEFDEPVTVTGAPRVALTIGAAIRQADYASGSGTTSLEFAYTVAAADADPDGVSVGAAALARHGGTIRDAAGNNAALGFGTRAITNDGDARVDGAAADRVGPTVTGVTISGRAQGANGVFRADDEIEVTVEFHEAATVTGMPRLALTIGSATPTPQADYASGSGTASLVFRYTVVATDDDSDGISIGASALTLNGGTIRDASGNAAALDLGPRAVTNDPNAAVRGGAADRTGPAVTGVSLSGRANGANGANGVFIAGDEITVTVAFDEPVTVTGTPQVALGVGAATRQAAYRSGSGTTELAFAYTVASGDADADGISVGALALALNGGAIADAATNAAERDFGGYAISDDRNFVVNGAAADAVGPVVSGVDLSGSAQGANGVFRAGDEIVVTVEFDEAATVTGAPQLALTVGAATRQAGYRSGSGTTSLVFRYTVAAADADSNGISVGASALSLNGGTIRDAANNSAADEAGTVDLGSHAITDGDLVVDGGAADAVAPVVAGVTLDDGTPTGTGGVYRVGDAIEATVSFSEAVTVTGRPQLALTIGSATRQAGYRSGSGTSSLVFRYTVASGDTDANGISIGASALKLNGGTIRDGAATPNDAALGLGSHAITDGDLVVDGGAADVVRPVVTGVTLSGTKQGASDFIAGDVIAVTVEFDEPVTVTGTPQVALTIGTATRQAAFVSGSGTTSPVFAYTVAAADTDADGVGVGGSALTLNDGTIADAAGNAAALGLGSHAIANHADYPVDGSAADAVGPVVTGVTLSGIGRGTAASSSRTTASK